MSGLTRGFTSRFLPSFALIAAIGSLTACSTVILRRSPAAESARNTPLMTAPVGIPKTAPLTLPSAPQQPQTTGPTQTTLSTQPSRQTQTSPLAQAPNPAPIRAPEGPPPASAQDVKKLEKELTQLTGRLTFLEAQTHELTEKLNMTKHQMDTWFGNQKAKPAAVISHGAGSAGAQPQTELASHDPMAGFSEDNAVRLYRKSMVLFKAQSYPESNASFSDFLEKHPDHPLAGMAQFYIGQGYMMQKKYKLAIPEFQRVLTTYDRSPYVAQTLREMAEAEDHLKKTEDAARHRQLLTSLFPHSPDALFKTAQRESAPPAEPMPAIEEKASAPGSPPTITHPKLDEPPSTEPLSSTSSRVRSNESDLEVER